MTTASAQQRVSGRPPVQAAPRAAVLLACLFVSACGQTNQEAPAAVLSVPSSGASPLAEVPGSYPSYGLVNDTSSPVNVMGCGPACPRTHLAPDGELDFTLMNGRVSIGLADGTTTCLQFMHGVRPLTPPPRQILRISKDASAASC